MGYFPWRPGGEFARMSRFRSRPRVPGIGSASSCKAPHEGSAWIASRGDLGMESFQKRERDRRKRQKRQDKAERRRDRSETKKQRSEGATSPSDATPAPLSSILPTESDRPEGRVSA